MNAEWVEKTRVIILDLTQRLDEARFGWGPSMLQPV